MKMLISLGFAAFIFQQIPLYAQIVITETDIRSFLGEETTYTFYEAQNPQQLQAIVAATGNNLTFDFTLADFNSGEEFTTELVTCSAELPGCSDAHFQGANFIGAEIYADSVLVSFAQLDATGFFILGGAGRGELDPTNPGLEDFTLKFTPPLLSVQLPLTMGTAWESTTTLDTEGEFLFTLEESSTVEGWGTLLIPGGQADALKVMKRSINSFSLGELTFADTSYTVTLYTKTGLSADIELTDSMEILSASYSTLKLPSVNVADEPTPYTFKLDANYPNPFNPITSIPFSLNEAGHMELVVFDLLGKEIDRLVDEFRPAGEYVVQWTAENIPSGQYMVRLTVDQVSQYHIMTLIK